MEEILKQILSEVSGLKEEIAKVNTRLDNMPTKTDLEKTIAEQQNDVIALLERTATKEDINKLNAKFEVFNSRLFHQEAELYELKAVK